jgi:oligopeptide transport system substrate-binding protein
MIRHLRSSSARSLALVGAACVGLVAIACDGDRGAYFGTTERRGRDPNTFYVNNGTEPEYLDPGKAHDSASTTLVEHLFEGLVSMGPEGQLVPGVALRWEQSDDNRLYRFHLRDDARWSDGRPVTAHDFEYAWKRVLTPSTGSQSASNLHVLQNGQAFHLGRLKTATRKLDLHAEPSASSPVTGSLGEGEAVLLEPPDAAGSKSSRAEGGFVRVLSRVAQPSFRPELRRGTRDDSSARAPALGWVDASALSSDAAAVGVRAVGALVLEVALQHPTPYFIELLAHPSTYPVPRELVEGFEQAGDPDRWTRPEHLVNNGTYALDTWRFRYEITMKRNPHHRSHDQLRIHRIVWMEVESNLSTMNLYKTGELDFMGDNSTLPNDYMSRLSMKKDFHRTNYLGTYWYELNVSRPPLDDVRVRRALDLGIDKMQLVTRIVRGGQAPATHYVPDFTGQGYSSLVAAERAAGSDRFAGPGHDFDPALGRELLGEAGFPVVPDGDGLRAEGMPALEILYNTSEGHKQIAVAVQDMWKKHLGVSVSLRNEEWKVMLKNVRDRNFQIVRFGWIADYDHPHTFLDTFLSTSPNNRTGWSSPEFDALVERAAATAERQASIDLYRSAEAVAVDAMPKIPLYFYTKSTLMKPYVKGFRFNARNRHHLAWMWIDPAFETNADDVPAFEVPSFPAPGRYEAEPSTP